MKASAYLLLVTRREKHNGKYPVKIRVVYNRAVKDYTIGLDLTEDEYNGATAERPKKEFREISVKLDEAKIKANNIIESLTVFTYAKFSDAFYGRVKDASDIFILFDEYISILKKEERIKTAVSYTTAKNSFKNFKSKISFYDITTSFLKEYHASQAKRNIDGKIVGLSDTTIGIYVRSLRSIFNYAVSLGIIKKDETYPFGKRQYIIPAGRNIKKALKIEEVKLINNYKTIAGSAEDKARDFWIFSYLCSGINFKDISLLKNKNIDGEMLRFVRAKTKNSTRGDQFTISCHLATPAKAIVAKWRNTNVNAEEYLFPVLSKADSPTDQAKKIDQFIQTTNKYMKRISTALGFERAATTYFSRHSAATILKKSGASIFEIQEALGHHSSTTTQKYLSSFDDESKIELSKSLSNFF